MFETDVVSEMFGNCSSFQSHNGVVLGCHMKVQVIIGPNFSGSSVVVISGVNIHHNYTESPTVRNCVSFETCSTTVGGILGGNSKPISPCQQWCSIYLHGPLDTNCRRAGLEGRFVGKLGKWLNPQTLCMCTYPARSFRREVNCWLLSPKWQNCLELEKVQNGSIPTLSCWATALLLGPQRRASNFLPYTVTIWFIKSIK